MSDDLAVVDTLSTASVSSSGSNALSDVSKQLPQSTVDAWNAAFNAAKAKAMVSPNPLPAEAASPSNAQHDGLNFALPPGGTYDPQTDTWERTQGAERQQSWPASLPSSQSPSAFLYGLPQSTPSSAASDILPNAPTSPAAPSMAPGASFADRFGATSPAQTMGGTSPAAGATAQASHSSAARNAGATSSPIDPAGLPPGPLNQADYARVGERNRYLASKYDPNNLYDRFINSFTGAMNDPANVRTPSEQAEHDALSQKIIDTVFPQPTAAEARLNMMAASPIGATLSAFASALGGSQQAQDRALIAGNMLDTFGLGRGLQTGEPPSVTASAVRSSGRPPTKPAAAMPEAQAQQALIRAKTKGASETGGSLPVAFDGAFATQQLLGTTTTPGGRQIMSHAADRMVNPPKGRIPMSPADIDEVLDGATKVVKRNYHPEGNTLTIENQNMPGRPRVIVDEATGHRVITVINSRTR